MGVEPATEARAQIIEEQFWAVVANIPGAVYRCSCRDNWPIRFISDYIELLCGYPAADFVGNAVRTYGCIIHPHDRPHVAEEIDRALEVGAPYSLQYRVLHADGGVRWVSERGRAILGEEGERLWLDGVLLDITEQVLAEQDCDRAEAAVRQQAELNRHQALHDSLTGLPNRVLFQDRVRQVIRSAEREGGGVAVMVMDLDRFKEINDTLGHASGDQLLVEASRRLRTTLRGADSIARLGGDEFAIVLHDGSPAGVAGAARRIHTAFAAPFSLDGLPLQIEASIGAATYPEHDRGQDRHQPQRLSLISELRRAIDERELVLHYSPSSSCAPARCRGGGPGALAASDARAGRPHEFIGVAQETSLIRPLTLYVIDEAPRQCRAWSGEGHTLAVAVNVSTGT